MEFIIEFEDFGPAAARLEALPELVAARSELAGTEVTRLPRGAGMGARGGRTRFRVMVKNVAEAGKAAQEVAKAANEFAKVLAVILPMLYVGAALAPKATDALSAPPRCEIQVRSGATTVDLVVPCSGDQEAMRKALEEGLSKLPQPADNVLVRSVRL